MRIPRTMSTQHPDNVQKAPFTEESVLAGDDEIKEAFYAYSELGITEQLWDFEGKDVDTSVVRKLLSGYEAFFKRKQLGKDIFLTYRVPNPTVEKAEGKILLETLENIPRSTDVASFFYGKDTIPVFEVCLPMVTSSKCLVRIAEYYKQFVVGKEKKILTKGDRSLGSWIGSFHPKEIRVVPLIEDKNPLLCADKIVEEFVKKEKVKDYQRVWLARSDPALHYGSASTVLIEKIALQRLHRLSEKISLPVYPILGCGSAPFRGNFNPLNVEQNMKAYPSVHTFTLQSAFKYDYDQKKVKEAVQSIETAKTKNPLAVNEKEIIPIINKIAKGYQEQIKVLAPTINQMSQYIPKRRKRKLHIGLFGYAREGKGVQLPRAITFCASLYSLGIPPELLGLHTLSQNEIDKIRKVYISFDQDIADAAQFLNEKNLNFLPQKTQEQIKKAAKIVHFEINEEHKKVTSVIFKDFKSKNSVMKEDIEKAGLIRGYLG